MLALSTTESYSKAWTHGAQQQREVSKTNWHIGLKILHTGKRGVYHSDFNTNNVNKPRQVLTMHATNPKELCVIKQPQGELSEAWKVQNESAHVSRRILVKAKIQFVFVTMFLD